MRREPMKSNIKPQKMVVPLTTLKELREEKLRLQREISETEGEIKLKYRSLVDALTFRNIINTIAEEIITTNLVVSQAYSIVRPLFKRKKKKKRVSGTEKKVLESH
jgi:hypothetical protein